MNNLEALFIALLFFFGVILAGMVIALFIRWLANDRCKHDWEVKAQHDTKVIMVCKHCGKIKKVKL